MTKKKPSGQFAWRGKLLRVDLTVASVIEEDIPEKMLADYIGGAGINARLLYDALRANPLTDPLSPENPLIFGCGPIVGTAFPCATRFTVTAKSPQGDDPVILCGQQAAQAGQGPGKPPRR